MVPTSCTKSDLHKMNCFRLKSQLVLLLCFSVKSQWCIEIRQDGLEDVRGVSGSKVELVCEVGDLRYGSSGH